MTNLDVMCQQTGLLLTEEQIIATAMRNSATVRDMLDDEEVSQLWPSVRSFLRANAEDWPTPEDEWRAFLVAEYIDLAADVAAKLVLDPSTMDALAVVVDAMIRALVRYLQDCSEGVSTQAPPLTVAMAADSQQEGGNTDAAQAQD